MTDPQPGPIPDQHARFRPCPIGCGWTQEPTEFDDETGLRAGRGQHLDGHTTYEIIEALEHRTAERDKAATERDRLARRCALRFEETERLRAQIDAHEGEMGDLRASLSAAEAKRDQVVENAVAWMGEARHQAVERDRLADTIRRYGPVIEAAKAWRAARPGPWTSGADVEFGLLCAVDALGDVGADPDGEQKTATTPDPDPGD